MTGPVGVVAIAYSQCKWWSSSSRIVVVGVRVELVVMVYGHDGRGSRGKRGRWLS